MGCVGGSVREVIKCQTGEPVPRQAYLRLLCAPRVKLGFNTGLLQRHILDREVVERPETRERHGWILKARGSEDSCSSDQSLPPSGSAE